MKNRSVGAEALHVEGWTDRQTRRSEQSLFVIMRMCLQNPSIHIVRTHAFHCLTSLSFRIPKEEEINGYKAHVEP